MKLLNKYPYPLEQILFKEEDFSNMTAEQAQELKESMGGGGNHPLLQDPPKDGDPPADPPKDGDPPADPPKDGDPPADPPKDGDPPADPPKDGDPPADPPKDGDPPVDPPKDGDPPKIDPEPAFGLKNIANGQYESQEALEADLLRISELEQQLEAAQQKPKFESERAEKLYNFANSFEGQEMSAARDYLHVQSLDLEKLDGKDARLEAFRLNPEFKSLNQADIIGLFEHEEKSKFGDPNDEENPQTVVQKTMEKLATDKARGELQKIQSEFGESKPATPSTEDQAASTKAYLEEVTKALQNFEGVKLSPSFTNEGSNEKFEGALNFTLEKGQPQVLKQALVDPQGAWDTILLNEGAATKLEDGSYDINHSKFGELMTETLFRKSIQNGLYRQGHNDGIAYQVKTHKNLSNANQGGEGSLNDGNIPVEDEQMGLGKAFAKGVLNKELKV